MDLTSDCVPAALRLLIGSTMKTWGLNSLITLWKVRRCISRP